MLSRARSRTPYWPGMFLVETIIAFGAYLRVSEIGSDFPFIYSPDEPNFVDRAVGLIVPQLSRSTLVWTSRTVHHLPVGTLV